MVTISNVANKYEVGQESTYGTVAPALGTTWGHIEEPIFYFKEPGEALIGTPSWDQVKFGLVRDMKGIVMKLD